MIGTKFGGAATESAVTVKGAKNNTDEDESDDRAPIPLVQQMGINDNIDDDAAFHGAKLASE